MVAENTSFFTIQAPRHRYFSVLGLLMSVRAKVTNQDELDLAIFSSEPLHFKFWTDQIEKVVIGLKELTQEFGEEFNIIGAD